MKIGKSSSRPDLAFFPTNGTVKIQNGNAELTRMSQYFHWRAFFLKAKDFLVMGLLAGFAGAFFTGSILGQQSTSYADTRSLLLKGSNSENIASLFSLGSARIDDLIAALDDESVAVQTAAQRAIRYLAEPNGLDALYGVYLRKHLRRGHDMSTPPFPVPLRPHDYELINRFVLGDNQDIFYGSALVDALILDPSQRAESVVKALLAKGAQRGSDASRIESIWRKGLTPTLSAGDVERSLEV